MVLGKKVAIFDWEWAEILPLEKGRKSPGKLCFLATRSILADSMSDGEYHFEKRHQLWLSLRACKTIIVLNG